MKIFFIGSIRGKEEFGEAYKTAVSILEKTGNKVFAEHLLKTGQSDLNSWDNDQRINFHKRVLDKVKESDVVVAEASYPSFGVGYLVSVALDCGKPTIVLHTGREESNFIKAIVKPTDRLQIIKYRDLDELKDILADEVKDAADQMDVRFNFFISPKIGVYLDWISKNKKIPRAVFLRKLIEEHMAKNKEFKGK